MNEQQQSQPDTGNRFVWTVEAFDRFWDNPDLNAVAFILTKDVCGYWPGASNPVRGRQDYAKAIGELLAMLPDFRGRALDHCGDENRVFIQWEARATGRDGPLLISGVDRVLLRDGLVVENRIYSDHPVFLELCSRIAAW